jgi:hypothetical protein
MAETIAPVVYGNRRRWGAALALHATGATLSAAIFGGLVAWTGGLFGAPWGSAGPLAVGAVAAAYGVREVVPKVEGALLIPQARRQVPDWWRTFFSWPASSALYGAGLGVGFFSYLAHGTLLVVAVGAAASGSPLVGAALLAPFGLARGLSPVVARNVATAEEGRRLVDRLAESSPARRRVAHAIALGAVVVAATMAGWRARPPDPGAWSRVAAAALALTFAWAAVAKLAGRRRWIRTLESHALPEVARRIARSGVPIAEALVAVLVVLGYRRMAGAWALALLAAFTAVTVRARVAGGRTVPCGCFGGRARIDVRTLLARNAGIGAIAVFVMFRAVDASTLTWPAPPTSTDALPVALAVGAILVAAVTGLRAAAWLHRGSRP